MSQQKPISCEMISINRRVFVRSAALGAAGLLFKAETALAIGVQPIRPGLLARARAALQLHQARIRASDVMAIVDFSAPSSMPRLSLLNLLNGDVKTLLVAHGKGSDPDHSGWVERFSNRPGSEASAAGSYLTGDTYVGHHGMSRRLVGLEATNDQAENRAIVIHAARYVDAGAAQETGKIGRSQGCFAVSPGDIEQVLARLGAGRLIYADKV